MWFKKISLKCFNSVIYSPSYYYIMTALISFTKNKRYLFLKNALVTYRGSSAAFCEIQTYFWLLFINNLSLQWAGYHWRLFNHLMELRNYISYLNQSNKWFSFVNWIWQFIEKLSLRRMILSLNYIFNSLTNSRRNIRKDVQLFNF